MQPLELKIDLRELISTVLKCLKKIRKKKEIDI